MKAKHKVVYTVEQSRQLITQELLGEGRAHQQMFVCVRICNLPNVQLRLDKTPPLWAACAEIPARKLILFSCLQQGTVQFFVPRSYIPNVKRLVGTLQANCVSRLKLECEISPLSARCTGQ